MKTLIISLTFTIFLFNSGFSQGPGAAAVPFVGIGPSPALGGSEGASAVIPTDDSFGFFYNPAQLGIFSHNNNFALQLYLERTKWLPQFNFNDLYLKSYAINTGYILKDYIEKGIDLNIGVGYIHTLLNLGESIILDVDGTEQGRFNSKESYDAFALGLGIKYFAYFALGYTFKYINSELAPAGIAVGTEIVDGTADVFAHDFGLLISVPLAESETNSLADWDFVSNAYLAFAMTNIGGNISYGKDFGDPIPRTAKLGMGFSLGFVEAFGQYNVKVIELELANEANDLLVKDRSYQSLLNTDIDFIRNVFLGNSADLVEVRNSLKLSILESIYLGFHKKEGPGFTSGINNLSFMISMAGLFKVFEPELFESFGKYIDIRYARCEINAKNDYPIDGTKYQSISIHLNNIFK